jgi:colanic acid/amylovoran biosynthesis glycosyltransferase
MKDFSFNERALLPGEPIKLLTVGRLVEKKGIDIVIRAIAKLKEQYPLIQYHIIGEGPLRLFLQELIKECDLEGHVILHGSRDATYVRELMHESIFYFGQCHCIEWRSGRHTCFLNGSSSFRHACRFNFS